MSEIKSLIEKQNTFFANIEKLFKGLSKSNFVAATVQTSDGKTLYYDGELATGTKIFMDEAMTQPAPDGVHELADGTKVTTANGEVTEVMAKEADETAAIKAELEAEKAKVAALEAEKKTLVESQAATDKTVAELQTQFAAMKKAFTTGADTFAVAGGDPKGGNPAKPLSWKDQVIEQRKAKAEAAKK